MRKLFLILFLIPLSIIAQDYWEQRDSVNGPARAAAASFELDDEMFVTAGVNIEENKRKMYSYDLDQDDWDDEVALGGPTGLGLARNSAIGFSALGFGYIGLGSGTLPYMKDLWQYNPETESWTQMADFIGEARNGAVAFAIDSVAYIGTGNTVDGLKNDFYAYNILSNSWHSISPLPEGPRKEAVGFTMGGKGYVGTGRGEDNYYNDFWEYFPVTDEWTKKASLPGVPRLGAVGCGNFPRAYIMMGETASAYLDDVWEYNYFGDIWTQRADFIGGQRTQASAEVVDGRIFAGLGYDGEYHDDFYEYIPNPLSSEKYSGIGAIEVYPNPTLQYCFIKLNNPIKQFNFSVFDINGKEVTSSFIFSKNDLNTIRIERKKSDLVGLFIIRIKDSSEPNSEYLTKILFN
ncbi:kelch repeat-containing protein [Crocinitomix algicola]|uniref:kelch repeat-containing protein n=1 Tax=Crocinitomix algicola TaxID=1740263 RepID=UPI0008726064|nr:kelch repeat-containing protein [Crocinitomix algicola]